MLQRSKALLTNNRLRVIQNALRLPVNVGDVHWVAQLSPARCGAGGPRRKTSVKRRSQSELSRPPSRGGIDHHGLDVAADGREIKADSLRFIRDRRMRYSQSGLVCHRPLEKTVAQLDTSPCVRFQRRS